MNKVILKRTVDYLRPLYYSTDQIHARPIEQIYIFNDKEQFRINRGWLENQKNYGRDVESMEFDSLPLKRKIDFNNKFSFVGKYEDWNGRPAFTLFLYAPDLKTEVLKAYNTDDGTVFYKHLYFDFNGVEMDVTLYDRKEKNANALKTEEIQKILIANGVKIDTYNILQMLKYFNIESR